MNIPYNGGAAGDNDSNPREESREKKENQNQRAYPPRADRSPGRRVLSHTPTTNSVPRSTNRRLPNLNGICCWIQKFDPPACSPSTSTATSSTPRIEPLNVPRPPVTAVPPKTTATITCSSSPRYDAWLAEPSCAVKQIAASAARMPLSV